MSREIVTVDLSNFEARKHDIAKELLHAAADVGFFYVSGHGCGVAARRLGSRACGSCRVHRPPA